MSETIPSAPLKALIEQKIEEWRGYARSARRDRDANADVAAHTAAQYEEGLRVAFTACADELSALLIGGGDGSLQRKEGEKTEAEK